MSDNLVEEVAKAMGYKKVTHPGGVCWEDRNGHIVGLVRSWDPRHNPADFRPLLRKLKISIRWDPVIQQWHAVCNFSYAYHENEMMAGCLALVKELGKNHVPD